MARNMKRCQRSSSTATRHWPKLRTMSCCRTPLSSGPRSLQGLNKTLSAEPSGMSSCVRSGAGCAAALAMPGVAAPEGATVACLIYEVFLLAYWWMLPPSVVSSRKAKPQSTTHALPSSASLNNKLLNYTWVK